VPPLDTLVTEARPPPKTSTMPRSVVVMILPPESTLSVPPESTITPVLVCPELTLRVPPLETVGIAKAPGQQASREAAQAGPPHPPTLFFSGANHTTERTRGPQNSGGQIDGNRFRSIGRLN
jgi:hypothetical protein